MKGTLAICRTGAWRRASPAAILGVLVQGAVLAGTVSGPPLAGNGIPDGFGSTAGRFFFRLSIPTAGDIPLDVALTSSSVTAEPVTCSELSAEPCSRRGEGVASVSGVPSSIFSLATGIKLAGAVYLPRNSGIAPAGFLGHSLEMALEGALYAGSDSMEGSTADLRLFGGNPLQLLEWGGGAARPSERPFKSLTGTGILLGDDLPLFFPGWIRGEVASAGRDTLLIRFRDLEIDGAEHPSVPGEFELVPDHVAAAAAGLPSGTFGVIEINRSGFPSPSHVFDGASSNDLELILPATPDPIRFRRGDCDGDLTGDGSVSDAVFLLTFNFLGGEEPPCLAACDVDGDGRVLGVGNDALYLLQFYFLSRPPPPEPYPLCGPEEDPSGLSCDTPPGC